MNGIVIRFASSQCIPRPNAVGGSTIAFGRFFFFTLLLLIGCAPRRAQAQFIGYTAPQTNSQSLATNLACTGALQNFPVSNFGQVSHIAQMTAVGAGVTQLNMVLQGSTDGVTFTNISDALTILNLGTFKVGGVYANGYYTVVRVQVNCSPVAGGSTFSLAYSGVAGGSYPPLGSFLQSTIEKDIYGASAGSNSPALPFASTPYGSSAGQLLVLSGGGVPTGSTVTFKCGDSSGSSLNVSLTFSLSTTAGALQAFNVPPTPCVAYTIQYLSGGASGSSVTVQYFFSTPGLQSSTGTYTHITTTTATAAKANAGFLHALVVNTAAAGTISIFDLPAASCTGTPATSVVAVITVPAATNGLPPFLYDVNLLQGICVKASVAMDFTVSSQ